MELQCDSEDPIKAYHNGDCFSSLTPKIEPIYQIDEMKLQNGFQGTVKIGYDDECSTRLIVITPKGEPDDEIDVVEFQSRLEDTIKSDYDDDYSSSLMLNSQPIDEIGVMEVKSRLEDTIRTSCERCTGLTLKAIANDHGYALGPIAEPKHLQRWTDGNHPGNGVMLNCGSCDKCDDIDTERRIQNWLAECRQFRCRLCGHGVPNRSGLRVHMRTSHGREKPYGCSICAKRYTCEAFLDRHMRSHSKPYGCSVCGKMYSENSLLTVHIRSHSGEKPYTCSICGKMFGSKGRLTVHVRTHSYEKPYGCSVCGKMFSTKRYVKDHMKTHKSS